MKLIKTSCRFLSIAVLIASIILFSAPAASGIDNIDYNNKSDNSLLNQFVNFLFIEYSPLSIFAENANFNLTLHNTAGTHSKQFLSFLSLGIGSGAGIQYFSLLILFLLISIIFIEMLIAWEQKKDGKKEPIVKIKYCYALFEKYLEVQNAALEAPIRYYLHRNQILRQAILLEGVNKFE